MTSDLDASFVPLRALIDARLEQSLATLHDDDGTLPPPRLLDAMRYSLLAKGKRLRPILVLHSARACLGDDTLDRAFDLAWPAALSVEYIHTYSLIHDDLPALDNDSLRRGRPTLHRAFDEATAILAGDALLTDAFTFISSATYQPAAQVRELALAAGSAGMVGGQALDMMGQGTGIGDVDVDDIHRRKTGRLFIGACLLGGLAANAPPEKLDALRRFGADFGLAFQIMDDVLDVVGDVEARGKAAGGDLERDKATSVREHGLDASIARVVEVSERAAKAAEELCPQADLLASLARSCADRSK